MCDGASEIAIATLVIAAASATYSAVQQNQAAQRQKEFNANLKAEGDAAAQKAYQANANAIQQRSNQQTISASQQAQANQARAQRAMASARTSAGEAGVTGLSLDSLLGDFSKQQAMYDANINMNLAFQKRQDALDLQGAAAGEQSQEASYLRPDVIAPGYIGAALRIGGSAMDAYSTEQGSTRAASGGLQEA